MSEIQKIYENFNERSAVIIDGEPEKMFKVNNIQYFFRCYLIFVKTVRTKTEPIKKMFLFSRSVIFSSIFDLIDYRFFETMNLLIYCIK